MKLMDAFDLSKEEAQSTVEKYWKQNEFDKVWRGVMVNKKNLFCLYCLSIMPMIMNQYGWSRTAGAITGFINLFNPIGVFFYNIIFCRGMWKYVFK